MTYLLETRFAQIERTFQDLQDDKARLEIELDILRANVARINQHIERLTAELEDLRNQ